jgi:hypothetical protein
MGKDPLRGYELPPYIDPVSNVEETEDEDDLTVDEDDDDEDAEE